MLPPKKTGKPIPGEIERFSRPILDSAYKVHAGLGPGLLESIYEFAMIHELDKRGVKVQRQIVLPVHYDGVRFDSGLKLDLLVEN